MPSPPATRTSGIRRCRRNGGFDLASSDSTLGFFAGTLTAGACTLAEADSTRRASRVSTPGFVGGDAHGGRGYAHRGRIDPGFVGFTLGSRLATLTAAPDAHRRRSTRALCAGRLTAGGRRGSSQGRSTAADSTPVSRSRLGFFAGTFTAGAPWYAHRRSRRASAGPSAVRLPPHRSRRGPHRIVSTSSRAPERGREHRRLRVAHHGAGGRPLPRRIPRARAARNRRGAREADRRRRLAELLHDRRLHDQSLERVERLDLDVELLDERHRQRPRSGRLPQVTTASTGVPDLRASAIARLHFRRRGTTTSE